MSVDPLSAVLQAVRLKGAVFFLVDARAPWAAEAPKAAEVAAAVIPGAQHVLEYHVIARGECWGGLIGKPPVRLVAGDVIAFPHGDAHVMSSAPGMRNPADVKGYIPSAEERRPFRITQGSADGEPVQLVCGFLGCDARPFNPLLETLPRLLHVRAGAEDAGLRGIIELAVAESQARRAGGEAMLARISELLFVEAVRRYLRELDPEGSGWLSGLRDPIVGRALSQLHARPRQDWTLDELARECASSRSVLAERFTHFVGQPPMQYLARWRMQLAASLLLEGQATMSDIADRVGYGSEAAFSRAFKKLVGSAPSAWREQQNRSTHAPVARDAAPVNPTRASAAPATSRPAHRGKTRPARRTTSPKSSR